VRPLTIAVDAMGGDHAPAVVVAGAVAAVRDLPTVHLLLVGQAAVLNEALAGRASDRLTVVDAPDVIGMEEAPLAALRRKPQASIRVSVECVARGDADAIYSAGHTGATLLAAHAGFGLAPGAERPALAVRIPTLSGEALLLDTGATMDCRPEHLRAFAVMGAAYARMALGVAEPRVGLLSVGEESGKGTELVRAAHPLLAALGEAGRIHYRGNIEARDMFSGQADVIVTDGFTGNVALKMGEGLVAMLEKFLRDELGRTAWTTLGAGMAKGAFQRFFARVDAGERGGAPLLGLAGLAVVGHGRSKARAIRNGIVTAVRLAEEQMVSRLAEALR
jgi:glycerol-3-phosphate acyltransferase PlsX